MGKAVKYLVVTIGGLTLLFCAALLIGPYFIDVEQFKPKIEQLVTEKTGYPLTIKGDIDISVFPWVGLSFTDLKLDNPEGFQEKKFLTIKNFQARLKLLPLLSKRVEIHRFTIDQPEIFLTKDSRGFWNWQDPGSDRSKDKEVTTGESSPAQETGKADPRAETQKQLGIESLLVGECALTNGNVIINDLLNDTTRELSDINLTLQDVSLDKPIVITLQAHLNENPIQLAGSVGPVTSDPFVNRINFDIDIDLFKTLALNTAGYIENLAPELSYNVSFKISPFSPTHLFSQLGLNVPAAANNPKAFESIEAKGNVSGTKSTIALSDSEIIFDDSRLLAELRAKEFSSPELEFHLKVDTIDIDRYLPLNQDEKGSKSPPGSTTSQVVPEKKEPLADDDSSAPTAPNNKSTKADKLTPENAVPASIEQPNFDPLRKLVMNGDLAIDTIKVHGGVLSNLVVTVDGKDGLFNLTSLKSELYQGSVSSTGHVDLSKAAPVSSINLNIQNVQAGPLLKDFADKDIIEGALQADIRLTASGMNADQIKASLNGKGELFFQDGAIIGIDLAHLARDIKSGFTLDQQGERLKTDFAELHAPFTISNGLVDTKKTTLKSPFIRVNGSGKADLVSESIDFRLNPKLVGTIKGQGDKEARSGIAVPVIVGGTFDKPTFSPDLEALVKQQGIDREEITEILETGKISPERKKQMSEEVEKAKSLLKGLLGN